MSSSLRIALVAEGRTEFEVVNAALTAILAPRSFVLVLVQPDATRPQLGAGWGGVLKWCHQAAERAREVGHGVLEADPTLVGFDAVVLHLDADVATLAYADLGQWGEPAQVAACGWAALPCACPCPPLPVAFDPLRGVLLSWLRPVVPGARTVLCWPAMNTGAWQAAAVLPSGHAALVDLECNLRVEPILQQLPVGIRVNKKDRTSRARAALAVENNWSQVVARCSRAAEFEQSVKAVFP